MTDKEMIEKFLKKNKVTKCKAAGARYVPKMKTKTPGATR